MKCLSLWQPWASLLVHGKKRVETRGWPISHRGPLLIHAAKRWNGDLSRTCLETPFRESLAAFGVPSAPHNWTKADVAFRQRGYDLPFGAIVGKVDVVDCFPTEKVHHDSGADGVMICPTYPNWLMTGPTEKAFGDYSPGRFAFLCSNFVAFNSPIPFRGLKGLFEVDDRIIREAVPQ